jgi:hypothetical protein
MIMSIHTHPSLPEFEYYRPGTLAQAIGLGKTFNTNNSIAHTVSIMEKLPQGPAGVLFGNFILISTGESAADRA